MAKIEGVYSQWGYGATDDKEPEILTGGLHDDFTLTADNAPFIAAGVAAGVVRIVETTPEEDALLDGHVQSQDEGEAAYDAAQADGSWRESHLGQFVHDTETRLALSDEEANLTEGDRAWLTNGLADAYDELGNPDQATAVRATVKSGSTATGPSDVQDAQSVLGGGHTSEEVV